MQAVAVFALIFWGLSGALFTASAGADATLTETHPALLNAVEEIGGEEKLVGLAGLSYRTRGFVNADDQGYRPERFLEKATEFDDQVSYDIAGDRLRTDSRHLLHFEGLEGMTVTYREVVHAHAGSRSDGSLPFDPGTAQHYPLDPRYLGAMQRQLRLLNPHVFLVQALAAPGAVTALDPAVIERQAHDRLLVKDAVQDVILYVHSDTGKIIQLETLENGNFRRDVPVRVEYADWTDVGGLSFPLSVTVFYDGMVIREARRSAVEANPTFAAGLFELPAIDTSGFTPEAIAEGARQRQFPITFRRMGISLVYLRSAPVAATEIAPGVHYLGGGTAGSLVVEQGDHLVLLEAPVSEERSLAISDWIASRFAGDKPVKYLVPTHHHQDHAAGVRTIMALGGVALVVADSVTDFWSNRILSASSVVEPDLLSAHPLTAPAEIIGVADGSPVTVGDERPVSVYRVASAHAEDMTLAVAAAGRQRIVFQGDLYNLARGNLVTEGPRDFINKLQELGLIDPDSCQAASGTTLTVTAVHAGKASESIDETIRFLLNRGDDIPCQMP